MITPKTISFEDIGEETSQDALFGPEPTTICHGQEFIDPTTFTDNLSKEVQSPESQCLIVVDILSQEEMPQSILEVQMVKISEMIPTAKLLNFTPAQKQKFQVQLQKLDICQVIKKHKQPQSETQLEKKPSSENLNSVSAKKYGSFSFRFFPYHKSLYKVTRQIPSIILPLAQHDILSYQKAHKIHSFQYILALPHYVQKEKPQLQTILYLNWGQENVQFLLFPDDESKGTKIELQPLEILVIPPRYSYKWTSSEKSLTKLMTWKIIPKKGLSELLINLANQSLNKKFAYSLNQALIDYCFHEFSLIEAKNQELMFIVANYINQQFSKEFNFLKDELNVSEKDLQRYTANDMKIDECQQCGQQIVNFFAVYKDTVYCVYCAKTEYKINQIYHKIPQKVFQFGCQLLTKIYSIKKQQEQDKQPVHILAKNAVFFDYEDFCNGDFIGAYNSANCKIHEGNSKKRKNSKQQIIENTVTNIKQRLGISTSLEILSKYSAMKYTNQAEKELYQQILVRTSNFVRKEEEKELLKIMMPEYKEDDLKLFAIRLCAKDQFGSGLPGKSK